MNLLNPLNPFNLFQLESRMVRAQVSTVGELRRAVQAGSVPRRTVHEEVRENLITRLRAGGPLFSGIIGYDDTVVPQLVNALLSRHNFILLGLRGQAKTRLLRALVTLLDEHIPVMPGCEINDDPLNPICATCRTRLATEGDHIMAADLVTQAARRGVVLSTPDALIAAQAINRRARLFTTDADFQDLARVTSVRLV